MSHALQPHPTTPSFAVGAIDADVSRVGAGLTVRYRLSGRIGELILPPPAAPVRTDGLWRHTCFEAFVAGEDGGYDEFNFAPSGQWAAYRFDSYRAGMRPLEMAMPQIVVTSTNEVLELTATFAFAGEGERLGLAAVIEEVGGGISYWALTHPPGKPDFHHADCFALDLAAMQRP
jgi:hypothetical protein